MENETEQLTIEIVKKVAMENYNNGGDSVIECWTDEDIQNYIDGTGDYEELGKGSMKDLLESFSIFDEVRKEIQATAF